MHFGRQSVDQAVVCGIHPDKDATLQCLLCLKSRVPSHLSYHCTGECLQAHWPMHRANHIRYLQQAHAHYIQNGTPSLRRPNESDRIREWIRTSIPIVQF